MRGPRTRRADAVLATVDAAAELAGELAGDVLLLDAPSAERGGDIWSVLEMLRADASNLLRTLRAAELLASLQGSTAPALGPLRRARELVQTLLGAARSWGEPRRRRRTLLRVALRATVALVWNLAEVRRDLQGDEHHAGRGRPRPLAPPGRVR